MRIDLWGDEVDRLTEFSVTDQRSTVDVERVELFPCRELLPTQRCARGPRSSWAPSRGGASSGSAWPRALTFDGMESWLPWLTEGEHVLFDLVGRDAHVLLVEPRRMRDRAAELLDEEADLASTLAETWGATSRDDGWPRLHLPFDRLLTHTDAPVRTIAAAPEGPGTAVVAASGWDPVVGDGARLVEQLRELLADGYRVVVAADGSGSAHRIAELLADEGVALRLDEDGDRLAVRRERRGRAPRAGVRAAGRQAGGAGGERRHRSPARPPPTSTAP